MLVEQSVAVLVEATRVIGDCKSRDGHSESLRSLLATLTFVFASLREFWFRGRLAVRLNQSPD